MSLRRLVGSRGCRVRTDPGSLGATRFFPVVLMCLAAPALLSGCDGRNRYVAPPPPKVTVAVPLDRKITRYLETTGNVQAINSVDLMARVQGYLEGIGYKDGA